MYRPSAAFALGALLTLVSGRDARADDLSTTVVPGQNVNVVVDVDACVSGYSFCGQTGANGMPAAGNTIPVLLMIQLIGPTLAPVTGLTATDFRVDHVISPSGAGVVLPSLVTCPACFADLGDGVYRYVVQPNGTWTTGTYIGQLQITVAGRTLRALVPIDVP
jgi:hypothetical protein